VGIKIDTLTLHKTQTRHKSQEHASTSLEKNTYCHVWQFPKTIPFQQKKYPNIF
jgi:hypothetical protein